MADLHIINDLAIFFTPEARSLSGTITVATSGVARRVLLYKNAGTSLYAETISASDGTWGIDVNANGNDRFRVVIVGQGGEYSKVFRDVVAG